MSIFLDLKHLTIWNDILNNFGNVLRQLGRKLAAWTCVAHPYQCEMCYYWLVHHRNFKRSQVKTTCQTTLIQIHWWGPAIRPPEAPSYVCPGKHPKSVLKSPIIGGWNPLFRTGMACMWRCTWVTRVTDIQKKKILRYAGNQEVACLRNSDTQQMYLHYET